MPVILFLTILFSCNYEINTTIYLRDIDDFIKTDDQQYNTRGTILIQLSSDDKIEETYSLISGYFKNISKPRLIKRDYYSYMEADIEIPVNKLNTNNEFKYDSSSLINILLKINNDNYEIGLHFDKEGFESLRELIYEKYYQSLDIEEFKLILKINNDLRTSNIVSPYYVYVDNEPYLYGNSIEMKPRDEVIVRLSDVLRDFIYKNSNQLFLRFEKK